MYAGQYQTGKSGVEVLTAAGKDPGKNWALSSSIHKTYDATVKGFVFNIGTPSTSNMRTPPATKDTLGLTQRYLVIQCRFEANKAAGMEIGVFSKKGHRLRLHFSSLFRDYEKHELHTQIPLTIDVANTWHMLVLDLQELVSHSFRAAEYSSVDSITLKPHMRVRKVFTLPHDINAELACPAPFAFPSSTLVSIQSLNASYVTPIHPPKDIPPPTTAKPSSSASARSRNKTSLPAKPSITVDTPANAAPPLSPQKPIYTSLPSPPSLDISKPPNDMSASSRPVSRGGAYEEKKLLLALNILTELENSYIKLYGMDAYLRL